MSAAKPVATPVLGTNTNPRVQARSFASDSQIGTWDEFKWWRAVRRASMSDRNYAVEARVCRRSRCRARAPTAGDRDGARRKKRDTPTRSRNR